MSAHRSRSLSLVCVCCLAAFVAAPAAARAAAPLSSTPDQQAWVTNGTVVAIAIGPDGTTYIGGNFTYVGPNTGGGAALDATSGAPDMSFPLVEGACMRRFPTAPAATTSAATSPRWAASPATTSPTSSPTAPWIQPSTPTRTATVARPRRLRLDRLRRRRVHLHRRPDPQRHRRPGCEQRRRHGLEPRRRRLVVRPRRLGLDRLRRRGLHSIGGQTRTASPPWMRAAAPPRPGTPTQNG